MLWKNQILLTRKKHKDKTVEQLEQFKKNNKKSNISCHSYVAGKIWFMPITIKYAGRAEVFRLEVGRLDLYECFCTIDHKFLTFGGMLPLKDLKVGDDFIWIAKLNTCSQGWYIETERVRSIDLFRQHDDVYSITTKNTKNFIVSGGICCGADYAI